MRCDGYFPIAAVRRPLDLVWFMGLDSNSTSGMSGMLIILGASARAAAFSALRAGLDPYCGDYFADADLRRRCPATAITDYPDQLEEVARQAPPGPWMYTGAIENYPDLIERICAVRPLLGNRGDCLARVRDPFRLAEALLRAGLAAPAIATAADGLPKDGSWLRKAYRSGGGAQVVEWIGEPDAKRPPEAYYFQQRITGTPCAGVYVAADRKSVLLGVSQQLIGVPWTGARSFHYAGSVGPWRLEPTVRDQFIRLGDLLSAEFGLKGLFGVDAMLDGSTVWPIEVNPRFPASLEVLERAMDFSAVGLHVAACQHCRLPDAPPQLGEGWTGKAIVWARHKTIVSDRFCRWAEEQNAGGAWPELADIPNVDTHISAGSPITTVLAEGRAESEAWTLLQERAAAVYEHCNG